ncbi:MAG: elongation factor P hydroxylase [Halieaceae bacterium]|jgi:elongation factor P hydroxylase
MKSVTVNLSSSLSRVLSAQAIARAFDQQFLPTQNTCLRGGAEEPLYEPARDAHPAKIWFREDYASSALHEAAHWCIAGPARRLRRDYGYWYDPDGRSGDAQEAFMQVEARPQALEWYFSKASGVVFRLSLDNLDAPPDPRAQVVFASAVYTQAIALQTRGLPPRAQLFFRALAEQGRSGLEPRKLKVCAGVFQ